MSRIIAFLGVWLIAVAMVRGDDLVRVDVTADTWVSSYEQEAVANNGGETQLKLKGYLELVLLDIDPAALRGRVIESAELVVTHVQGKPLGRVTVSSVAGPWLEGTGLNYDTSTHAATYNMARQGERHWAYPGSDITDVIASQGQTRWAFADPTSPNELQRQRIDVDPAVMAARVAGISHGFALIDDVGNEYQRQGEFFEYEVLPDRWIASRESADVEARPLFRVRLGATDRRPPEAIAQITGDDATLPAGQVMVRWSTPRDNGPAGVIGYNARYMLGRTFDWESSTEVPRDLIPMAGEAGEQVRMHLRDLPITGGRMITVGIKPIDAAGNVGPLTTATLHTSDLGAVTIGENPALPFRGTAPLPILGKARIFIVDPLDKIDPQDGQHTPAVSEGYRRSNHLWDARTQTVRLFAARNEFVAFQFVIHGRVTNGSARLDFITQGNAAPQVKLYRYAYVAKGNRYWQDPLLPLTEPITIPTKNQRVVDQVYGSYLAEVYVPHDARPGLHEARLVLRDGDEQAVINVKLNVWNFTLSDVLSFLPVLTAQDPPDYEHLLAYHRLAHEHRTCLVALPYDQRGQVAPGYAPQARGNDWDWTSFDQRFGPLLDGSAFADLPRKGVPVAMFQLPINENWPVDIERGFEGGFWADTALRPAYRLAFVNRVQSLISHLDDRRWRDTAFVFFLTNRVYDKKDRWSRSSAPWVFDQPLNTQDFHALRWYGQAFQQAARAVGGSSGGNVRAVMRADVSQPWWQRDSLDGLVDILGVGQALVTKQRLVQDRGTLNRQRVLQYGSTSGMAQSAALPAAWCVDAWIRGADGVNPWRTMGDAEAWRQGDDNALFYPPPGSSDTPMPGMRLKAFRRGQQDVEYLTLLAQATDSARWQVALAASNLLILADDDEQAQARGVDELSQLSPMRLWRLRMRVGNMLDKLKPTAQKHDGR